MRNLFSCNEVDRNRIPVTVLGRVCFCVSISLMGIFQTASATNDDHLELVNRKEAKNYRIKMERVLFVTPADFGRMSVRGGSDLAFTEFVVSVYAKKRNGKRNFVTVTRASGNVWHSMPENRRSPEKEKITAIRCDAEIAPATAMAIRRVWKKMLQQARPHDYSSRDLPTGGEIVEFSLVEPGHAPLFGELPAFPAQRTLALQEIGMLLVDYCKASPSERLQVAEKIREKAQDLSKKLAKDS